LDFSKEDIQAGIPRLVAEKLPNPYGFAISKSLRRHVEARTSTASKLWTDLNR
jgi:hypothetical protein